MKITKKQFKFWGDVGDETGVSDEFDDELIIEHDPKEYSSNELADYILECQEKAEKYNELLIFAESMRDKK